MSAAPASLHAVRTRIEQACARFGRPVKAVRLVAVSKTVEARRVRELAEAGQRAFGENYLQEAMVKQRELADLRLEWHFIGALQSNKARDAALHFDWVHGVDRLRLAQRLSAAAQERPAALNVCVQVNISGEASKSGCAPESATELCRSIAGLPGLRLRGLMAIPAPAPFPEPARRAYRRLRELFEHIRSQGLELDTLSAGMSDDLEAAIAEGATLVRIGSALFGQRP